MKKIAIKVLVLVCLLFNIIMIRPVNAVNIFTEGIYKASDFNVSSENLYSVQNISETDSAYVIIFDTNQLQIQSIRLIPKSAKYNLVPLNPDYRVVVVGKGEIYIDVTELH